MSLLPVQTPTDSPSRPTLRPSSDVMSPEGLSAYKSSRLSFLRLLIGKLTRERWQIARDRWELDAEGRGLAIYRILGPDADFSFVVFSDNLPEERRTDRIVENHYDGEAFLCIGPPSDAQIEAQRGEFADFLTGRADAKTVGWTRVNRSGRIFDAVVDALAEGRQPDDALIASAGYLVRNNGFWGNGRHGSTIFPANAGKGFLGLPYHADLLTLYLWRHFSVELAEHIARSRAPNAVPLAKRLKTYLGVGNASGLGLVPFVLRHPARVDHWVRLRERAYAEARARRPASEERAALLQLLDRAIAYYDSGQQVRGGIFQASEDLVADLRRLRRAAEAQPSEQSWDALAAWAEAEVGREALELLHALLLEIHPEIAEALTPEVLSGVDNPAAPQPAQRVEELQALLRARYAWALAIDLTAPQARQHFWYLSRDNLEPRLGERGVDPGEAYETYVDVVGDLQSLDRTLSAMAPEETIAHLLLRHPALRLIVERVQTTQHLDYGEVRACVTHPDFEPCHLIRFTLTLYGMEKLDPQSRLWVRGTFLQGAPLAEDIATGEEGDWIFPMLAPDA